jgi:hypothetical protein
VDNASLVGIDPATGSAKFTIPLEHATGSFADGCDGINTQYDNPPNLGQLIVAGDGYAYLTYEYREEPATAVRTSDSCTETGVFKLHARLLRVAPNGTSQKIAIGDWTKTLSTAYSSTCAYCYIATQGGTVPAGNVVGSSGLVTNADSGVAVVLNYDLNAYCSYIDYPNEPSSGCVPTEHFHRLVAISSGISSRNLLPPVSSVRHRLSSARS